MTAKRPIPRIRVTIRLEPEMVERINGFADAQQLAQSETITALLDAGLACAGIDAELTYEEAIKYRVAGEFIYPYADLEP